MTVTEQEKSIHWLIPHGFGSLDQLLESNLASVRLRAGVALNFVYRYGWSCTVGEAIVGTPEILVIGKIGGADLDRRQPRWVSQIMDAKSKGSSIVLDYTDHHLGFASPMTSFYREILPAVDVAVCPSGYMKKLLEMHWAGRTEVIEDAIEVDLMAPKTELHRPVTMLWFGHATNAPYLARFIQSGLPGEGNFRLVALTNEPGARWLMAQNIPVPQNLRVELYHWSLQAMVDASREADLCIIPSDVNDPKKSGASANRLITALALGMPVAAENLNAYVEFEDYYVDISSDRFAELLGNPLAFSDQVARAQMEVVPRFERSFIAEKWLALFEALHKKRWQQSEAQ
jgi:hypothetical protein